MIDPQDAMGRVPVPADRIVGKRIEQEYILVSPDQGKIRVLNLLGAKIWEMIDGERSIAQIVAALRAELPENQDCLQDDTLVFLASLEEKHLIHYKD